jgi:hypothetical protein
MAVETEGMGSRVSTGSRGGYRYTLSYVAVLHMDIAAPYRISGGEESRQLNFLPVCGITIAVL